MPILTEQDFLKLIETGLVPGAENRESETGLFAAESTDKGAGASENDVPGSSESEAE